MLAARHTFPVISGFGGHTVDVELHMAAVSHRPLLARQVTPPAYVALSGPHLPSVRPVYLAAQAEQFVPVAA